MVFNATFNNISVIIVFFVSFIGGGNWSTRRKPLARRKSLKTLSHNVVSSTPRLSVIQTHKVSGDKH